MSVKIKFILYSLAFSALLVFLIFLTDHYIIEGPKNLLVTMPFAFLMSIGFGYLMTHFLNQKINTISEALQDISSQEFSKKVNKEFAKEFEGLSQQINDIRETIKSYLVSASDKSILEDKLITILEVVSMAAEGDFTKKAPVTPDMIGTISDAFNLMSDGLVSLINEVKTIAIDVSQQSLSITSTLHEISKEVNTQMLEVAKGAKTVGSALGTFHAVAEKALDSSTATDIAFKSSRKGRSCIDESVQSMQIVRNTSALIARKMKSLNERILEIGKIMEIITEVASRTHLLALNASIEASRAGEQGKGFLTIADEIRKLSDKSTGSAKEIENIIKSIQMEASEMTLSIDRGTQQVEVVDQLTKVTESSFQQVEDAVSVANTAMVDIAQATKVQVTQTEKLHNVMNKVSQISRKTVEQTHEIVTLVEGLNNNSNSLLTSIGRFKTFVTDSSDINDKMKDSLEMSVSGQEGEVETKLVEEIDESSNEASFQFDEEQGNISTDSTDTKVFEGLVKE